MCWSRKGLEVVDLRTDWHLGAVPLTWLKTYSKDIQRSSQSSVCLTGCCLLSGGMEEQQRRDRMGSPVGATLLTSLFPGVGGSARRWFIKMCRRWISETRTVAECYVCQFQDFKKIKIVKDKGEEPRKRKLKLEQEIRKYCNIYYNNLSYLLSHWISQASSKVQKPCRLKKNLSRQRVLRDEGKGKQKKVREGGRGRK